MARRQVDPALLEGEELRKWFLRTPDEIEEERRLAYDEEHDAFFGQGRWQEARAPVAPPLPVRPPPTRVAPPPSAGALPQGAQGSFFGTYPNIRGGYIPLRPYPLNAVEQVAPDGFGLADGSVVSAAELERIYAEQTRRMAGNDEVEPARQVRHVDRVPTGRVPSAAGMAKTDREDDPTCHPYGGWEPEPDDPKRSERSRKYEAQITRAPGLDYVVRIPGENAVKFDGCAVWDSRRQLLEAKGPGYAGLALHADKPFFRDFSEEPREQAVRHDRAARGRQVDWHVAEKGAWRFFKDRVGARPNFGVYHTPPKAEWRLVRRRDQPATVTHGARAAPAGS